MPALVTRRIALRTLLGSAAAVAALGVIACTPKTEVTVAGPGQQTGITVIGTTNVSVKPDVARLNLGVEATDTTVAGARSRAADAMTKVQAALKTKGVQEKDIRTQTLMDEKFRAEEDVERASLDEREMQFLYRDGDFFYFMDTESYEQIHITAEALGDSKDYLIAEMMIRVEFYEEEPVGIELPATVDLVVKETVPGIKGATASAQIKPATLETGLVVNVPSFRSSSLLFPSRASVATRSSLSPMVQPANQRTSRMRLSNAASSPRARVGPSTAPRVSAVRWNPMILPRCSFSDP